MSFLKRWKASETNLVGPDFNKAEWLEINLSGTVVKFKNPDLSAMIPYTLPITKLDIYNLSMLNKPIHDYDIVMSKALCNNGWNFYSGLFNDSSIGGMLFDMILFKSMPDRNTTDSFFRNESFMNWILHEEKSVNDAYNKKLDDNRSNSISSSNSNLKYKYPTKIDEINKCTYNNQQWYSYTIYKPGDTETIVYRTAIEDSYILSLTFEPTCYNGEYYSPAHNLEEVANKAIEELMQSMNIKLSEKSQQQLDLTKSK